MYTKVLVPLDGSKLSESILPYVRSLAKALKIPVELLHAIDPEVVSAFVNPSSDQYADVVEAERKRKGLEYLEPVGGSFPDPIAVNCSVAVGKPAEVIVEIAAADPATLVAMATHGRSGIQRWLLGSVANKVLHTTRNPLFLVRATEKMESTGVAPLKRVIVPLDGSLLAEKALPHVVALATKMDLEILLLQVYGLSASVLRASDGYVPHMDELLKRLREEAQQHLDQISQRLAPEGFLRVFTMTLEGEAAGHIIDIARKSPDSLVAMCTHGRSGVARLVLGSVTDRVIRHCGDPVLVIRASSESK